jgi:hypothetical protein
MTTASNPYEMLTQAAELIQERGQNYGEIENNFQLIADLFSLRVGRPFHPYEACILLECVKDARMFATPMFVDNYLDGINYRAFAALFAEDYAQRRTSLTDVAYQRKDNLQKAEMKPVVVKQKTTKGAQIVQGSSAMLADLEKIETELAR